MIPFIQTLDSNTVDSNIVNVYILTGQSNSVGRGDNADATAQELAVQPYFKIWSKTNSQFESLEIGVNNLGVLPDEHGIELGLAKNHNTYYPNQTGYLIKWGKSSTEIVKHLTGGEVYEELWNNYVIDGINSLINEGKQCRVFLIYSQGERDANTNLSPPGGEYTLYSGRFDTWVSLWQSNFGATLPIVSYQLLDVLPAYYEKDVINGVFASKALSETYYSVLQTKNLTNIGDNLHYDYQAHKDASVLALDYFSTQDGYLQTTLLS